MYLMQHNLPEYQIGTPIECPKWQSTTTTAGCHACDRVFGLFTRRQHCVGCGKIFCLRCLHNEDVVIPAELVTHWQRQSLLYMAGVGMSFSRDLYPGGGGGQRPKKQFVFLKLTCNFGPEERFF